MLRSCFRSREWNLCSCGCKLIFPVLFGVVQSVGERTVLHTVARLTMWNWGVQSCINSVVMCVTRTIRIFLSAFVHSKFTFRSFGSNPIKSSTSKDFDESLRTVSSRCDRHKLSYCKISIKCIDPYHLRHLTNTYSTQPHPWLVDRNDLLQD